MRDTLALPGQSSQETGPAREAFLVLSHRGAEALATPRAAGGGRPLETPNPSLGLHCAIAARQTLQLSPPGFCSSPDAWPLYGGGP